MSVAGRSVGWASSFCFASWALRRAFITNNFPSTPPCSSPPPPRPRPPRPNQPRSLPTSLCQPCRRELSAFSAPETFTADNLYDKVDGKADLYLTAGFVGLQCQRLALKATNDVWMEWFVYDMGTLPQAFSVFSLQRRAEAQTLDLTPFAYQPRTRSTSSAGAIMSRPSRPCRRNP